MRGSPWVINGEIEREAIEINIDKIVKAPGWYSEIAKMTTTDGKVTSVTV
jgi:hypothetical protein